MRSRGIILWKWNFVFDISKVKLAKDLCVLDINYDHDDIYEMNPFSPRW